MADPVCVLQHLNRHFEFLWDTSMFATAIVAVLDARLAGAPCVECRAHAAAPHPRHATSPKCRWPTRRCCCGTRSPIHRSRRFSLEAGDRVVLYTDGITDRCGPNDSRFDLARLTNSLARNSGLDMPAMLAELNRELDAFACTEEPDDDQTVLAVEIK